ncbi:hypothetical protein [Mesoaciditoga sp.]
MKKILMGVILTLSIFTLAFAFNFLNGSFEVANDIWQSPKFEFPSCGISDIAMTTSSVIILSKDGELDVYSYDGTLKNYWSLWNVKNVESTATHAIPYFGGMSVANDEIFVAYSTRGYIKKEEKKGNTYYVDIESHKKNQNILVFNLSGKLMNEFGDLAYPTDIKVFNSKIYVTDGTKDEVMIYNMNGKILQKFKMPIYKVDSPKKADVFLSKNEYYLVHHPESLTVLSNDIYVVGNDGFGRNFLYKFDQSGRILKKIQVSGDKIFTFAKNLWISDEKGGFVVYDENLNKLGTVQKIQKMKIESGLLAYHKKNGKVLVAVSSSLALPNKSIQFFYLEPEK